MKIPYPFDDELARFPSRANTRGGRDEARGGVEGNDRSRKPVDPVPDDEPVLWLKITGHTDEDAEFFKWDYTVSGHAWPGSPALWTGRQARNSVEFHNIGTHASGYDISNDGDCPITGVEPAPGNIYVRGYGPYKMTSTQWFYAFTWPNIPTVDAAGAGSGVSTIDGGSP